MRSDALALRGPSALAVALIAFVLCVGALLAPSGAALAAYPALTGRGRRKER